MSRVLHLLSQRPSWTGSGIGLHAVVRAADKAGWEQAVVVGTPADDPQPSVGDLDKSQVMPLVFAGNSLPFPVPGMSDVMPYRSSRFSMLIPDQLDAYRTAWRHHVAEAIAAFHPDIIHSHHYWLLSSMVKDVAEHIPVVTHLHGTGLRQLLLCPHLAEEVHAGCQRNERFIALHEGNVTTLVEAGVPRDRIRVIGNGFRPEIFNCSSRQESDTPVVTYAGKLSNAKGVPWLLDAIQRLSQRIPNVELHLAGSGSGEEADTIRARIRTMDGVVLHNQLDQPSLAHLLRRSTVFVLPSFYEGLPLVLVEAAACGCQLVATALPGIVAQLAPPLGTALELVRPPRMESADRPLEADLPEFVDRLAQGIETAIGKPSVQAPERLVSGMTWEAIFRQIEDVWRQAISGAKTE